MVKSKLKLNQKQNKMKRCNLLFCLIIFVSCNQKDNKKIIVPNSFEKTYYDKLSKIKRKSICLGSQLIKEEIFLNDSMVEYSILRSDTLERLDSLGTIEEVVFTYQKKIYIDGKLISERRADSMDQMDFCDCIDNRVIAEETVK
jgi:hypothetical protein